MIRSLRSVFVWGCKHGFAVLAVFLVAGYGTTFLKSRPAQADEAVDKLVQVALSDVSLSQRLLALEALKVDGGESAVAGLKKIAEEGDLHVAAAACAQLGRTKSSGSKTGLKALLADTDLSNEVLIAAASAIAEHWKDRGDKGYLEDKSEGNETLEAHYAVLKTRVYGDE